MSKLDGVFAFLIMLLIITFLMATGQAIEGRSRKEDACEIRCDVKYKLRSEYEACLKQCLTEKGPEYLECQRGEKRR
jgi:hypothetical protein